MIRDWFLHGGPIMYPLLACSLLSVTLTLERIVFWVRDAKARDPQRVERVLERLESGADKEAKAMTEESDDPIVQVFREVLNSDGDATAALGHATEEQARRMRRTLRIHDTIVTLAPLLGILGTVLGIINSFDVLAGTGIDDPQEVTGGIAEALVTTAFGLVVAMLSLIPYNYFSSRFEDALRDMEIHLTRFERLMEKGRQQREA